MTPPPPSKRRVLAMAACVAGLSTAAGMMFLPAMPEMALKLGTQIHIIQLAFTTFLIGNAIGQLTMGTLSDYFGRRRVVLAGMSILVLASVVIALTPNVEVLLVARVFQAIGVSATLTVARAVVRDVFEREEAAKAMSLMVLAYSMGPILGPTAGGFLMVYLGWRAIFAFTAITVGLTLVWAWFSFPESNRHQRGAANPFAAALADYRALATHPGFLAYAGTSTVVFMVSYVFAMVSPVLLIENLGVRPEYYGPLLVLAAGGFMVGTVISNRLTMRWGMDAMVWLGAAGATLGAAAFFAATVADAVTVTMVVLPYFIILVGEGFAAPNLAAGAVSAIRNKAGAAAGLMGFMQLSGTVLATLLVVALAPRTAHELMWPLLAVALSVPAVWLIARGHARRADAA